VPSPREASTAGFVQPIVSPPLGSIRSDADMTRTRPIANVMLPASRCGPAVAVDLAELEIAPDGAEQTDGNGHEEDEAPVDRRRSRRTSRRTCR